jgi:Icc-related predicted phosphoesterase
MFQLASDLHLDFLADCGAEFVRTFPVCADTLVLAGDVCEGSSIVACLEGFAAKFKDVVFVNGNHSMYGQSRKSWASLVKMFPKNVHYLARRAVKIEEDRFVGSTLWFDPSRVSTESKGLINDFRHIKEFDSWYAREFELDRGFFRQTIQPGDIVVSHHAPTLRQIHPKFFGSPLNVFFASDLDDLILETRPKYWVHGHIHNKLSCNVGETVVVANPLGYITYGEDSGFDDSFVLV